jgi:hypothetical protein
LWGIYPLGWGFCGKLGCRWENLRPAGFGDWKKLPKTIWKSILWWLEFLYWWKGPNTVFVIFGCFWLFLAPFWVIFSPIIAALDPFWACGWWIGSLMITSGYILACYAKKVYLWTQKTEVGHLFLKIHFCERSPP